MPAKLQFAPDFWRKRADDARKLAELIEDDFTELEMGSATAGIVPAGYGTLHAGKRIIPSSWV